MKEPASQPPSGEITTTAELREMFVSAQAQHRARAEACAVRIREHQTALATCTDTEEQQLLRLLIENVREECSVAASNTLSNAFVCAWLDEAAGNEPLALRSLGALHRYVYGQGEKAFDIAWDLVRNLREDDFAVAPYPVHTLFRETRALVSRLLAENLPVPHAYD